MLRLLAVILGTFIGVVLAEVSLALLHPIPYAVEDNMYFDPDPYTGYRLRPWGRGSFQASIPANANSMGLRNVEVPLSKPAGRYRILALGDSFTVGANVEQEQAYPQVLGGLLRTSGYSSVEVINAGVGGWSPFQYAQYFEYYGLHLMPDLVLIGFFVGNDAYSGIERVEQTPTAVLGRRVTRAGGTIHALATGIAVWLYGHSHFARLLITRQPIAFSLARQHCTDFTPEFLEVQKPRLAIHRIAGADDEALIRADVAHVSRIRDLAGPGVPVFVALLPDENQINKELQVRIVPPNSASRYDFDMPQKQLGKVLRESGVGVIDLLPVFREDPRCLYMNDTHWNPDGHQLAAKAITQALAPTLDSRGVK